MAKMRRLVGPCMHFIGRSIEAQRSAIAYIAINSSRQFGHDIGCYSHNRNHVRFLTLPAFSTQRAAKYHQEVEKAATLQSLVDSVVAQTNWDIKTYNAEALHTAKDVVHEMTKDSNGALLPACPPKPTLLYSFINFPLSPRTVLREVTYPALESFLNLNALSLSNALPPRHLILDVCLDDIGLVHHKLVANDIAGL